MRKYLFYLLLSVLPFMGNGQLLNEGFEGTTFPPAGWTTFIGTNGLGTGFNWGRQTAAPYQGAGYAFVRYENVTGGIAEDWMVTPAIDLTNYENAELTFYTRQDFNPNWGGNYYVKVSTTSQTSHASFTDAATWTELTLNTTYNVYEQKTVDLSAYDGQTIYVAFVMTNDDGDSWYIDDVAVTGDEVVPPPAGCLDAEFGQWPSTTFTPTCLTGGYQTITSIGYAGEFSKVNVTAGTEYTFRSTVSTDFITIANNGGTAVYGSGTGTVVWTAPATEVIRFYTHADDTCASEEADRTRAVRCGTPIEFTDPAFDCFQGDGSFSGRENGYGIQGSAAFRVADDFVVEAGTEFSLQQVILNMYSAAAITNVTINVRADNAGVPGAVVNTVSMAPTSSSVFGTAFGLNGYRLVFDLATAFELTEGTYWIEPTTTTAAYWEVTSLGETGSVVMLSNNTGTSWVTDDSGYDYQAVFFVAGVCEDVVTGPEGCLEAENGQWPSSTYVPSCLGVAEDVTTAGWTGEYSVVTVTNGQEYIFSVSDPTYFITIGDSTGATVLTSGTGSVTWTSNLDGNVRFYTHFDSDCDWDDETFLTRTIQCGEVPPPVTCEEHEVLSNNLENGLFFGGDTDQSLAVDLQVPDAESYSLAGVEVNVAGEATSFEIIFYDDAGGLPGAEINSVVGTIAGEEMIGSNFGFDWYTYTVNFDATVELAGGSTYWMEIKSDAVAWESTTASMMGMNGAFKNTSTAGVWTDAEEEFVYKLICGTVAEPEGCLEAENGQWPSATYTPECSGEAEDITTAAWTGEYSMVAVTSGTEYIFSVSDATYFITIGDEAGATVLASGTGSVTWTANVTGNVRFYTHFDSDCNWDDETFLTRTIQCGEVIPPSDYCEPVLDCTDGDVITNVTFAGINNTTDCSPNGYGDFTDMQATVEAGETYSMSVTVGAGWTFESTMVWIDFNNDFIFDPVTEYFFIGSDPGATNTADITIPAGTADGQYRLRVRVGAVNPNSNDLSVLACDEDTVFGETEDYTLVVGEAGPDPDCFQEVLSNNLEKGLFLGGANNQRLAVDVTVDANTIFTIETVDPTIIIPEGGEATSFNFIFYADGGGIPGTEIETRAGNIMSSTVTGQNFGRDFIRYTVQLDSPVVLPAGTYWMEMESDAEGWEATTASVIGSTLVFNNASTAGEWVVDGTNTELVYKISGTCETLGISDMDSFDFAYYPNPVKDELNITSQKVVQSVSVYNLAGQQVSTQKLNVTNGKVSTSSLTPGVYVFRAVLDGGQVETFKVIKK